MKKIITIITSIIISLSIINTTNADNLDKKLYKAVIITKMDITKDYEEWETINNSIVKMFIKLRGDKNKTKLREIKTILKEKIIVLYNKKDKSFLEKRKLNMYNNMYYRTVLLLDYNLK